MSKSRYNRVCIKLSGEVFGGKAGIGFDNAVIDFSPDTDLADTDTDRRHRLPVGRLGSALYLIEFIAGSLACSRRECSNIIPS